MDHVRAGTPPKLALPSIGAWVGEEALGVAIYCASLAPDFPSALRIAVNHDGNSDTTGALVGQLLGAQGGEGVLPSAWVRNLELRETITAVVDDLVDFVTGSPRLADQEGEFTEATWNRYAGW